MLFYEVLGLPLKLALDSEQLRERFYESARQSHPDLFGYGREAEQTAQDRMALLNDAYRTLRDPVARAEYFLRERGMPLEKTPQGVLEKAFDLQMALQELRGGDELARAELERLREGCVSELVEIDSRLARSFEVWDASRNGDALEDIRIDVSRRRYFSNLLRDVDKELNVHVSN